MIWKNTLLIMLSMVRSICAIDPLPSWNEGDAKKAILEFVRETTTPDIPNYIPHNERIAVFDNDGTLWVEQPLYTEYVFAIDNIKDLSVKHPEWKKEEPFKAILSGDTHSIRNYDAHDFGMLIAATHTGMTLEEFHQMVNRWLSYAKHPRYQRPYTHLVYQPMIEVMQLLKDNEFHVYIVSGGGQEFMRAFAEKLYHLPPSHIIGTTGKVKYEFVGGKPVLKKIPQLLFVDDKQGKPEGINLFIGKRPVIAFGNSVGDQQMLEWTQSNKKWKTLQLLVHHDDDEREYAYGPNSEVGTFSEALMSEAKEQRWIVISMKNDWRIIFSWQK